MLARVKNYSDPIPLRSSLQLVTVVNYYLLIFGPSTVKFKTYADQCTDTIFPKPMMLRVPKRLKSEEDKKLMVEIARGILDQDAPTETTLRKYFRFTSSPLPDAWSTAC